MALQPRNLSLSFLEIVICTERLRLAPIAQEHIADIFESFSPNITRYMVPKPATDIAETKAFVESSYAALEAQTDIQLAICDKQDGRFLGVCGLHARGNELEPELGIWLRSEAHGRRLGLEAIEGLIVWASTNIACSGFRYPVSRVNTSSRKLAERLGGRIVEERESQSMRDTTLDEVVYAIPLHRGG
ncbi:MAG: GNAT family N-acetyltransferase [Pseudomonadota bacterium]